MSTHLAVEFRLVCQAPQCGRVTGGESPWPAVNLRLERPDPEPVGLERRQPQWRQAHRLHPHVAAHLPRVCNIGSWHCDLLHWLLVAASPGPNDPLAQPALAQKVALQADAGDGGDDRITWLERLVEMPLHHDVDERGHTVGREDVEAILGCKNECLVAESGTPGRYSSISFAAM
jgi:hypothetical protein